MDFLDYPDVTMELKGGMADGRLKLTDEKLIFKMKSGKSEQVSKDEIEMVNWQRFAGTWGIRIFTNEGKLHRFAGFRDNDRERLAKFFSQTYQKDMLDRELSVKGWNWGTANFSGAVLNFEIASADAFEIPLPNVQQCIAGKNEVTLEFHPNDDVAVNLSEIRFHIPTSELAADDPVAAFKDHVMESATVMAVSGDAIADFKEISCLSPRGRYQIKVYPNYVNLHGKTFDYKIPAATMVRLFLLPHKDQRQMHFAVNCDPPIKQGQTRYHCLVFIFKEEEELDIEIPLTEEEIKSNYEGKLEKNMSGAAYDVISKLFRAVVGRKITTPKDFVGHSDTPAITCSHKAASGFLYPLEKGIIYIYRPPIYMRYDEISKVEFERTGGKGRSFDINISTVHDIKHTFSSIEKDEYKGLYNYLQSKKIKVVASEKLEGGMAWGNEKEQIDHYLANVKKDAEEFTDGSDDMSSDDEDFNPDMLEALSAKEEYDSEPSTTSDEDSGEEGPMTDERRAEKAKKRAERKAKKRDPKEKKERKVKKTKLPGQPKRNQSAYFIWMNSSREQIKSDHPGLSLTEFGKKAGELWKNMSNKSEWEEKAAKDKKRFEQEMEEWKKNGGTEAIAAAKKAAKTAKRKEKAATKSKPNPTKSSSSSAPVEAKGGSGQGFKSKEFIEDSSSGGASD